MHSAKGNALFLILIAVALFAALSYALTQSGRGGGGIDREQAEIKAAEIVQYVGSIRHAATRLRTLGNACGSSGNVLFDNFTRFTVESGSCPFNVQVFHSEGMGLRYPGNDASQEYGAIYDVDNAGDDLAPNVYNNQIYYAIGIRDEAICASINANLNNSRTVGTTTPLDVMYDTDLGTDISVGCHQSTCTNVTEACGPIYNNDMGSDMNFPYAYWFPIGNSG